MCRSTGQSTSASTSDSLVHCFAPQLLFGLWVVETLMGMWGKWQEKQPHIWDTVHIIIFTLNLGNCDLDLLNPFP